MKRVLVLGRNSRSTKLLLSVLVKEGYDVALIEERRDDKLYLLKRRIKKFGFFVVFSQLLFMFFTRLQAKSQKVITRLNEIESSVIDKTVNITPSNIFANINDANSINAIKNIEFDYIILSGTRILSSSLLSQIQCPILNIHAGINPAYRGVHGGYWALANHQPEFFGSTIHLVDEGVDTGAVLSHALTKPTQNDNFSTYPLLQMSIAMQYLPKVLCNLSEGEKNNFIPELPSNIWTHPTIWQYAINRFKNGIK